MQRRSLLILLLNGLARALPSFRSDGGGGLYTNGHPTVERGSPEFCLTLGLMGLDELHLRVLSASSGDPVEKKNAKKVLALMQKGRHWVLVVLLLGNVIINESLPSSSTAAIGGGVAAVAISTTAIGPLRHYIFLRRIIYRIIPQSLTPVAYPIAKLLDYVLGANEVHTYRKAELKSFLEFHRTGEEPLRDDEISILSGVLELNSKNVEELMTRMEDVVTLSKDTILDHDTVDKIIMSGYSRFPVHNPENPLAFVGLLLVKKLITYDPSQALPVSSFALSILPEAHPSINCFQALDYFQTGRAHLLLISRTPGVAGGAIGVVTLEDIIEEIITEEIVDETDRYDDNVNKRRAKRLTNTAIMKGIVERRQRNASMSSPVNESTPLLGRDRNSEGTTSG
ncbi:DUF21-domain-containing protein [Armillaria luteobubalina]|uniref:DUF21-domain-containing protein n=1 Tax=Armillaria luteobubalina TaxID=153913 RepID=A0AA39Q198_9AGAR|nr:DUF21-domain-containing protein [Armillaria luteobubalina]